MNYQQSRLKIFLKKIIKYIFSITQDVAAFILRLFGIIHFKLPPYTDRIRTGGNSITDYYESGLLTYSPIATMALSQGIKLTDGTKVLDFGCGVARQLLHFTKHRVIVKSGVYEINQSYSQVWCL